MKVKKFIMNLCFFGVVVVLVGSLTIKWGFTARANSAPTPYTVKLKQTVRKSDGTLAPIDVTMTVAVRRDGTRSVVHSQQRPGGPEVTRDVHLASGGHITVGDLWDIKTTWVRPRPDISEWYRDPAKACAVSLAGTPIRRTSETVVGEEMIAGVRTVKITNRNNAEWFALDCGCALVWSRYDFGTSINEQSLISLTPGDPDATLFHVPDTFKVVGPADYMELKRHRLGLSCNEQCAEGDRSLNKRYLEQPRIL